MKTYSELHEKIRPATKLLRDKISAIRSCLSFCGALKEFRHNLIRNIKEIMYGGKCVRTDRQIASGDMNCD